MNICNLMPQCLIYPTDVLPLHVNKVHSVHVHLIVPVYHPTLLSSAFPKLNRVFSSAQQHLHSTTNYIYVLISDLVLLQLKLVNPTQYRFEHLATQMKWRLQEGKGEAVYQIGVEDNGLLVGLSEADMRASLRTLHRMAEKYNFFY